MEDIQVPKEGQQREHLALLNKMFNHISSFGVLVGILNPDV
jgi:hypothetical protein